MEEMFRTLMAMGTVRVGCHALAIDLGNLVGTNNAELNGPSFRNLAS